MKKTIVMFLAATITFLTVNAYTVTLDKQGGSGGTSSVSVEYEQEMPYITPPTRTGYKFNGYYGSKNGAGNQYYTSRGESGPVVFRYTNMYGTSATSFNAFWDMRQNGTLYASWVEDTYTVTLDKQYGSGGTSSVTVRYGSEMPSITVPTRTGYWFEGYWTGTGGSGTEYYYSSGNSARTWDRETATTLYAKWLARDYTVTLDQQGGGGGTSLNLSQKVRHGECPSCRK